MNREKTKTGSHNCALCITLNRELCKTDILFCHFKKQLSFIRKKIHIFSVEINCSWTYMGGITAAMSFVSVQRGVNLFDLDYSVLWMPIKKKNKKKNLLRCETRGSWLCKITVCAYIDHQNKLKLQWKVFTCVKDSVCELYTNNKKRRVQMALLLLKTLQTTHFFSFLYSSQLRGFLNISYLQNLLHTHTPKKWTFTDLCTHLLYV